MNLPQLIIKPDCKRCTLAGTMPNYGEGDPGGLLVICEHSGDGLLQGQAPKSGASARLLRVLLARTGWEDRPVFVSPVTACRTATNRSPSKLEIECCSDRLDSVINVVKPTHIVLMGAVAVRKFLDTSVVKARGKIHFLDGIPTMATYHPNYVLRTPDAFRDIEFDLEKLLDPNSTISYEEEARLYHVIDTLAGAIEYVNQIEGIVSLDIETTGLSEFREQFTRIGIRDSQYGSVILKGDAMGYELGPHIERMSQRCKVLCHNADFEYRWFRHHYGIFLNVYRDTMLMAYSIDEREENTSRSLKTLGKLYFNFDDWAEVKNTEATGWVDVPDHVLDPYLAIDLWVTEQLYYKLQVKVEEEKQDELLDKVIMPLRHVLSEMTYTGVPIDREYLQELDWTLGSQIELTFAKIEEIAGKDFNPKSPKQLAELFFDKLKLPLVKGRSTDKEVLETLASKHQEATVAKLLLEIRPVMKAASTYVQGLSKFTEVDGRVHGKFNQHRTATGRLSSDAPNMQNIPARGVFAKMIRDLFYAPDGYEFLELDYSQVEVFVMAMLAKDERMIEVLNSGADIYTHVASTFHNKPASEVTKLERQGAKPVVLGAIYDRRAEAIAAAENKSLDEAREWLDTFFREFKGVRKYLDEQPNVAYQQGYVETLYGRRRRFPFITFENKLEVARQAINTPDQGTAADICAMALIRLSKYKDLITPILQIHDSLTFFVKSEDMQTALDICVEEMVKPPFEDMPLQLRVEAKRGFRWGSMVDIK